MSEADQREADQQVAAQVTIPVTIHTVHTTQGQEIAIPIGLQPTSDGVTLQQIQQLQQAHQLQQQQLQVAQLQQVDQVQHIQQQVQQINEDAQLDQQQQEAQQQQQLQQQEEAQQQQQIQQQVQQMNEDEQLDQQQQEAQQQQQQPSPAASNGEIMHVSIPVSIHQAGDNNAVLNDSTASLNDSTASLNDSTVSSELSPPKKKSRWAKYTKRYNKKWESEPGLKEWIRRVPGDDTKVSCRYCQNTIRAHHTELKRHSLSAKHKSQAAYVVLPFYMSGRTLARMVMRAVRVTEWGGPEVLQVLADVAIPEPQANQILIKVGAAGVNPVETYIRSGQYANLPSLPWTPGADCAGTVEIVGPSATKFRPGDRVYTYGTDSGTYAEYSLAPEDNVFGLPDQLDFKRGAGLGIPYFTAYRALIQRAHATAGHTVLVHGASGAVGLATVQFAKAYGMTVIGTAGTPEGIELVKKNGAHYVYNHRHEGYMDQVMTATSGEGVDVVIEMLANVNLQKDLEVLAPSGVIAVVGNRGTIEINPRLLMPKESSIVGVMMPKGDKGQKARRTISAAIRAGIESGWIKPPIGKEFPIEGASLAHHEIINGTGALGRIVLVP